MKTIALLFLLAQLSTSDPLARYRDTAKSWEKEIAAFEKLDLESQDPDNAILFIGSSSIRLWETMSQDMRPWHTIRRGYGGAKFDDLAIYSDRIITPHRFRALVVFVGNDITGGKDDKTPEEVVRLFKHVVGVALRIQPQADIFMIGVTPSESRIGVWPEIKKVNAALRAACEAEPKLHFIETDKSYLDSDGKPRSELFRDDKLHQNAEGYKIWCAIIKENLTRTLGEPVAK